MGHVPTLVVSCHTGGFSLQGSMQGIREEQVGAVEGQERIKDLEVLPLLPQS